MENMYHRVFPHEQEKDTKAKSEETYWEVYHLRRYVPMIDIPNGQQTLCPFKWTRKRDDRDWNNKIPTPVSWLIFLSDANFWNISPLCIPIGLLVFISYSSQLWMLHSFTTAYTRAFVAFIHALPKVRHLSSMYSHGPHLRDSFITNTTYSY